MEETPTYETAAGWKRFQVLSGSWIKVIAVVTMLIDHLAAFCWRELPALHEVWFTIGPKHITPYFLLRAVGRLAFPLFAFLLVEGFLHTRSRVRYGRNLLLFAFLSEIPWNLIHSGTWHYPTQNVFFTLFLGFLGLCAIETYKEDWKRLLASLLGLLALTIVLRADYGCTGFGFILLLYVLRNNRILQAVIGCCILPGKWIPGLAFIPINLYNGKRGFVKGPVAKYLFYAFYPVHLLVLYFLR